MCVAVPGRIVSIDQAGLALVDFEGATRQVSVAFLEDPLPGEYVIVHAGFALHKVDPDEARETVELIRRVLDDQCD